MGTLDPRKLEYGKTIPGANYDEWTKNFARSREGKTPVPAEEQRQIYYALHPEQVGNGPPLKTAVDLKDPITGEPVPAKEVVDGGTPDGGTPDGGTISPSTQAPLASAPQKPYTPHTEWPGFNAKGLAHVSGAILNTAMGAGAGSFAGPAGMLVGGAAGLIHGLGSDNAGDTAYKGFGQGDPQAMRNTGREILEQAVLHGAGKAGKAVFQGTGSVLKGALGGAATAAGGTTAGGAVYDYLTGNETPAGQAGRDAAAGVTGYGMSLGMGAGSGIRAGQGPVEGVKNFLGGVPTPVRDPIAERHMELYNQLRPENQATLKSAVQQGGAIFPTQWSDNLDKRAVGLNAIGEATAGENARTSGAQKDLAAQPSALPSAPVAAPVPPGYIPRPGPVAAPATPLPTPYTPRTFHKIAVPQPLPVEPVASRQPAPVVPRPMPVDPVAAATPAPFVGKPVPALPPDQPWVSPLVSASTKHTLGGPDFPVGEDTPVPSNTEAAASRLASPTAVQNYLADLNSQHTNDIRNRANFTVDKNAADQLAAEEKARFVAESDAAKQQKTSSLRDYLSGKNEADAAAAAEKARFAAESDAAKKAAVTGKSGYVQDKNAANEISTDTQQQNFEKQQQDLAARRQQQIEQVAARNAAQDAAHKQASDYHQQVEAQKLAQAQQAQAHVAQQNQAQQDEYARILAEIQARNSALQSRQQAAPQTLQDAIAQRNALAGLAASPKDTPDLKTGVMSNSLVQMALRNFRQPNSTLMGLRPETPVQTDLLRSSRALGLTPPLTTHASRIYAGPDAVAPGAVDPISGGILRQYLSDIIHRKDKEKH